MKRSLPTSRVRTITLLVTQAFASHLKFLQWNDPLESCVIFLCVWAWAGNLGVGCGFMGSFVVVVGFAICFAGVVCYFMRMRWGFKGSVVS